MSYVTYQSNKITYDESEKLKEKCADEKCEFRDFDRPYNHHHNEYKWGDEKDKYPKILKCEECGETCEYSRTRWATFPFSEIGPTFQICNQYMCKDPSHAGCSDSYIIRLLGLCR